MGFWNDAKNTELKELWAAGYSAEEISKKIKAVSRNAVIGQVHRLGLSGRRRPERAAQVPGWQRPTKKKDPAQETIAAKPIQAAAIKAKPEPADFAGLPAAEAATTVAISASRRIGIMELKDTLCKWPIGDPDAADFVYCGADYMVGKPYCAHHAQIAYQPTSQAKPIRQQRRTT